MTIRANLLELENRIHSIATAEGLTAKGHAPVLTLCRRLVMAGHDPAEPMEVYRGDVMVMTISAIGEGAKLIVSEKPSPQFDRYLPTPSDRRLEGGRQAHQCVKPEGELQG